MMVIRMWLGLVLSVICRMPRQGDRKVLHQLGTSAFAWQVPHVARTSRDPHCYLQASKCSKAPWNCVSCLDLSLSHCSEIGCCRGETLLVGKATD